MYAISLVLNKQEFYPTVQKTIL